jgi:hypothetical protein
MADVVCRSPEKRHFFIHRGAVLIAEQARSVEGAGTARRNDRSEHDELPPKALGFLHIPSPAGLDSRRNTEAAVGSNPGGGGGAA